MPIPRINTPEYLEEAYRPPPELPENWREETGSVTGRPPIYISPDDMQDRVNSYFKWCKEEETKKWVDKRGQVQEHDLPRVPTIEGLARHLGFASREQLFEYGQKKGFTDVVSRAKAQIIEDWLEGAARGIYDGKVMVRLAGAVSKYYRETSVLSVEFPDLEKDLRSALKLSEGARQRLLEDAEPVMLSEKAGHNGD